MPAASSETKTSKSAQAAATETMAKGPQEHAIKSIFEPFLNRQEAAWANGRNMTAMTEAMSAAMRGSMELANEAAGFVGKRVTGDLETMKSISACRNAEDYFTVSSGFFDRALREYADESAKMMHIVADAMQGVAQPIETRTKEALHSVTMIPKDNGHFV